MLYLWNEDRLLLLWLSKRLRKLPKQPKYFAVKTPVLDDDGGLQVVIGANGDDCQYKKEVVVWTCYHVAHQRGWKTYLHANR